MLCCVYTVINKLGLAKPEARPTPAQTVRCLSNSLYYFSNFIVMIWKVHFSCDPVWLLSLLTAVAVGPHWLASVVVVVTLLLLLLRPEPEAGRDLLIIWCVGGGKERDTDSYTDTLPGPGEASLSRPLIGHTPHVAALSLVRCYQWAWAWACAAHWALLENSDQGLWQ